jgi:hypothetical protein
VPENAEGEFIRQEEGSLEHHLPYHPQDFFLWPQYIAPTALFGSYREVHEMIQNFI